MARSATGTGEVPVTMNQAAASRDLGVRRFVFRSGVGGIAWWGVIMLLLVCAFCVVMTVIITKESGLAWASPFIGLGVLCLVGAVAIPLSSVLKPVEWCLVHEYGFVYQQGTRPPVAGFWDEISLFNRTDIRIVRNGMTMGYDSSATIDVPAGRVTVTKHFPAAKELLDLLQDGYYQARVQLALWAVRDGETRTFGAWQVGLDGLGHAGGLIPWARIRKIGLLGPVVEVYLRGDSLRPAVKALADDLGDVAVLLTLTERLRREAG